MYKVPLRAFASINNKIPPNTLFLLTLAVIEKKQRGNVFIDTFDGPSTLFIINKAGFSSLIIRKGYSTALLLDFFASNSSIPDYFHIYSPPPNIVQKVTSDIRFDFRIRKRVQFRYVGHNEKVRGTSLVPPGFSLKTINKNTFHLLQPFGLNLHAKFWNSKNHFFREGFGVMLCNLDGLPVSVCYSACVVQKNAEIDIATLPQFQGSGYGYIVTKAFINIAIKKNFQPNWDCFEDNIPSRSLALKTGFIQIKKYTFLSIFNKAKDEKN